MKIVLFVCVGLIGLSTLGTTAAKAGPDDYRDDGYYRRPVYRERGDDRDYCPPRRVVVVHEYERPVYYADDCHPYYQHRRHMNFFLPLPPPVPAPVLKPGVPVAR